MIDSESIRRAWAEAQSHFSRLLDDATSGDDAAYSRTAELSRINDYAYFVLFWGQFETLINETAESNEGDFSKEIDFMPRVKLCMPETHPWYIDVDRYYFWRCELAHGRISDFPDLVPPDVFDRIEEIAEAIQSGALTAIDPWAHFDFGLEP